VSAFRWEPPAEGARGPRLVREPLRFALVAGAAATIAGSFISWADGRHVDGMAVSFSPMTTADGVILPVLAASAASLVLSQDVARSRTRTLQVALAVLGVVAVLIWISALGSANRQIGVWRHEGGVGTIGAGICLAGVGTAVLAIAGIVISLRAWRTNGVAADPTDPVVTRRLVARAVVEVAGGVLGLGGGIVLALAATGPQGLAPMAFGSMFGAALGMFAGNRIGRLV
jgi:hypothetical protein